MWNQWASSLPRKSLFWGGMPSLTKTSRGHFAQPGPALGTKNRTAKNTTPWVGSVYGFGLWVGRLVYGQGP